MSNRMKGRDLYDFSNPKIIGPGAWAFMHSMAAKADTLEDRKAACKFIRGFCEDFKCGDCQGHCRAYVTQNPPENAIGTKDGLFYWTVQFRNDVQKRLGPDKPLYDPQIMYEIFHDTEYMVCEGDCAKAEIPQTPSSDKTRSSGFLQVQANKRDMPILQKSFGYDNSGYNQNVFRVAPRYK